jgi:hypothetical protein
MLKLFYILLYPWLPDGPDAGSYVTVANYLARGGSWLQDGPYNGLTGVTSPGYPMLLALFSGAVALTQGSVIGWKIVQVVMVSLQVPFVADLASRMFGNRAGLAAGIVVALSPVWFYSAEILQYEQWLGCFLLLGVWCLIRADGAPARCTPWWVAGAGCSYGVAALLQLKALTLVAPAVLYSAFVLSRHTTQGTPLSPPGTTWLSVRQRPWRGWERGRRMPVVLGGLSLFVMFAVLPTSVWGARNLAVHGEPLLGSTGAMNTLWMGNHEGATGGYMQLPRPNAFYERLGHYPERSITREARAFADLGWDYIRRNPSQFGVLALIKLERFWWTLTPDRFGEYLEARTMSLLGGLADATAITFFSKLAHVMGLALAGAGLLWSFGTRPEAERRGATPVGDGQTERRSISLERVFLLGTIVLFWLLHIPFIAEPRYRISIEPLLAVLQGAGLAAARQVIPSLPSLTSERRQCPQSGAAAAVLDGPAHEQ